LESESEGGQKFLPPNPLPFCPPERSVSVLPPAGRQSVGILFKMGSDFFQQTPLLHFVLCKLILQPFWLFCGS